MKILQAAGQIPYVTRDQMIEIDRLMIDEFDIPLLLMMENAGIHLADLACDLYNLHNSKIQVLLLCGAGNNGGGGMAAARHLFNRGISVIVAFTGNEDKFKPAPAQQFRILKQMDVNIVKNFTNHKIDLIIDALIGYGLKGAPRGKTSQWIRSANQSGLPIISLDIPSGFNADTGEALGECIRANATLTLALPKIGMKLKSARQFTGEIYIADISVPVNLYKRLNIENEGLFSESRILKIK